MVSEIAIGEIERLEAAGLRPTARDVIRLNALGLALERARARRGVSTFYLPRLAWVSDTLAFRQPTVGHELWIHAIDRLIDTNDYESSLAVRAFALSRPTSELPDPEDPKSVRRAVAAFAHECRDCCRDHLRAAIDYAIHGFDPLADEYPARRQRPVEDSAEPDWNECVAVGVLNEGRAVLWGASVADLKTLTVRQLSDLIRRAYMIHGMTGGEIDLEGQFYATVDEVEQRLKHG